MLGMKKSAETLSGSIANATRACHSRIGGAARGDPQTISFSPLRYIPATIILPADFSESTDAWQDILPGVAVEINPLLMG